MLPYRAWVFYGLNGVRALSIIALLLAFSSNVVTLANDIKAVNAFIAGGSRFSGNNMDYQYVPNSTIPNEPAGAAWGVISRLLIIFQVTILVMSEVGWPAIFFDKFFPVLGKEFGLGALGIFQCLLGASILSHHIDEFTLVSAFFLFSIGCLNIFVGLIWREKAKSHRSFTSWKAEDGLPSRLEKGMRHQKVFTHDEETASRSASLSSTTKAGYGFGRQGEKAAGLKGFVLKTPEDSLPKYAPSAAARGVRASSPVFSSTSTAV